VRKDRSSSLGRGCQGDQQAGRGEGEREEQEGRIGPSPHGPGRWEGQREERGRDVRVGLREPAGGVGRTWRCVEVLSGLVKGQVVIMDDTVDHDALGDMSPRELLDLLPRPREVREGQAPHGRHSGSQAGRSRFPLRREEDVGFVRVTEFKAKIDLARCWMCSRSPSCSQGRLRPQYCPRSS